MAGASGGAGGFPSQFGPFDTKPSSIAERLPGLTGVLLQDCVDDTYMESDTSNLILPLFSASGKELFRRHPLNDRDEHDSRAKLRASILAHGFRPDVRGGIWAVMGDKLPTGD